MEFVEINETTQTIRKFKGAKNRDEAMEHVLSYNRIYVFSVDSITYHKGTIDQFMEDLGIADFIKIGAFNKGYKGSGRFDYTCRKCGYNVSTDILPSDGICPDCR